MSTLWALDVLREGVGLLFNASLHCHWEPGQVTACELHALYGTDTTLPSLKTCNADCTRPDMKSRWNTFKHLMNFGVLSCLFIPGFQAIRMWKSVKRMGITVQTNIQHHSEKKPYPEPVYAEAGFYNPISKTYILLNWSLFCVNRDSCIRGWHCAPKSLVLVSHGWLSLSWLFYMYTIENKDSGDG